MNFKICCAALVFSLFGTSLYASSANEKEDDYSDLISGFPPIVRAIFNNKFVEYTRPLSPETLFEEIKTFREFTFNFMISSEEHKRPMYEKLSQFYEVVFEKAGGDTVFEKISRIDPSNTPVIVKSAYNRAVNLFNFGNFQEACKIFDALRLKGHAQAKKQAEICIEKMKKAHQDVKEELEFSTQKLSDDMKNMIARVESLTGPDLQDSMLESLVDFAVNQVKNNNSLNGAELVERSNQMDRTTNKTLLSRGNRSDLAGLSTDQLRIKLLDEVKQSQSYAQGKAKHAKFRAEVLENMRSETVTRLRNSNGLAGKGDVKGSFLELTKMQKAMNDSKNQVQKIPAEHLFEQNVLEELSNIGKSIYQFIDPRKDSIFFVGRSPLYISRMLQALYPEYQGVFEVPFSYKGNDVNLHSNDEQKKYQKAEMYYVDFLRRFFGTKLKQDGKIYVIDRYESGESVHKFCSFVRDAFEIEPKIIALVYPKKDIQDDKVASVILLSSSCVVKMKANDDVRGLDSSLGIPFSWGQWENWQTIISDRVPMGGIALARLKQIEEFTNKK